MFVSSQQYNAILETRREGYLAAGNEFRNGLLNNYKKNILKTKHLHANLLFTTIYGRRILSDICSLVTYIEPSVTKNSWKDLAVRLGYDDVKIKCLPHLKGGVYDPTELILQYYAATNKYSTIEDILQALLDLGFFPALNQAQIHIDGLIAEVQENEAITIEAQTNAEDPVAKKIVKYPSFNPYVPKIFDVFCDGKESFTNLDKQYKNIKSDKLILSRPPTSKQSPKRYCKLVMLTFANDGYTIAQKIASVLRKTTNKQNLPIGVMMLHENESIIQENPGQQISYILSKMDFVIPVLTEGYFAALKQQNTEGKLLDQCYVQFVYNNLISKYISNQCLNFNVRPIIPKESIERITQKTEFIHNTLLSASWKNCDEIQNLADSIVKSRRYKMSP